MTATNSETASIALEHAWKWFEFHAAQRLTMVRFYVAVVGALGGGVGYVYGQHWFLASAALSVFGAISAYSFCRLDKRVSDLVKLGERALAMEQLILASGHENEPINICVGTEKNHGHYPYTYRQNIGLLLTTAALLFLGVCFVGLLSFHEGRDVLAP